MLHPPAAQCTQQKHLVKALLRRELCGILGIGVVLDVGQHNDIVRILLRTGSGVKIAYNDIRLAAQPFAVAVARIAGNDKIITAQQAFEFRLHRAGGKDHTTGHLIHSSFRFTLSGAASP